MTQDVGRVSQLWRYPVSSFAGEEIDLAKIVADGMVGDRRGAYHERDTGKIVFPSVARRWNIAPRISARTDAESGIEISLDGLKWQRVGDLGLDAELASFCGTPVQFKPYGSALEAGSVVQRYAFSPIHLVSKQSLDALGALLPSSIIDVRRFRPNIVVDLPGLDGRSPENRLIGTEFTIGGVTLRGIRPSGRCSFTTLAQRDLPEDHDVLRTLIKEFGKDFGIYCEVLSPGSVAVGDTVALTEPERPIIIVGAGQAGAQVAKNLRDFGCRQPIEIFGDEPYAPYERPPLSKTDANAELSYVLQPDAFNELKIALHLSTPIKRLDTKARSIVTQDDTVHPYDRLVLATGGRARHLPQVSADDARVHVLRTADDASRLFRQLGDGVRLAIIGAGWLGMEMAASGRQRGCKVTVYARQDRILKRSLPAAVAGFIGARHRAEGVTFRLGAPPSIRTKGSVVEVVAAGRVEPFDLVVAAIGITPNDELASLAGVSVDDGILVNSSGQSSDPAIFGVGDVARITDVDGYGHRIESWHNANDQARAVARRLMYLPPEPSPLPRFWSTQYDMTIQIAGLPDPHAVPIDEKGGTSPLWDFGTFVVGINRPRDIRQAAIRLATGAQEAEPVMLGTGHAVSREPTTKRAHLGACNAFSSEIPKRIEVEGLGPVIVSRVKGKYHAADDLCPHAAALLSEGFIEGGRIVCPVHFAEFDLSTGQPFNAPPGCGRLRCYETEVVGDDLFIRF